MFFFRSEYAHSLRQTRKPICSSASTPTPAPPVRRPAIETYYLALASDESARTTAMRENAGAEYNMKELDALVGRILKESKSTESRRLAQLIQAQLTSGKQVKNRGVKHAPFVVLIGTKVPAVLVEVGFISNPQEGKKLTTKAYQRQLATSIAKGIEQYIKNLPPAAANQS